MKRPALHAIIILCGSETARITPPFFTDSYIRRAKPATLSQMNDVDTQIQTIYYYITGVYPVLIHWWVVYAILLPC